MPKAESSNARYGKHRGNKLPIADRSWIGCEGCIRRRVVLRTCCCPRTARRSCPTRGQRRCSHGVKVLRGSHNGNALDESEIHSAKIQSPILKLQRSSDAAATGTSGDK